MNKMINMLKNVNLSSLKNEKSLDDLIERCKQEGRVEGAIKELVDLHHYICSDININEKELLKFIDKRLKELERVGEQK